MEIWRRKPTEVKKKEFWNGNIKVSGWNETDFCDKRGHTCLYKIKTADVAEHYS